MGGKLAKYRRDRTYMALEQYDRDIEETEAHAISIRAKYRRWSSHINMKALIVYIIAALIFYIVVLPMLELWTQLVLFLLLFVLPILVSFLKKAIILLAEQELNRNNERLAKLREEKNKVIEEVKHNETYMVALEVLGKFGDKDKGPQNSEVSASVVVPINP